jgi:hypothetical protein
MSDLLYTIGDLFEATFEIMTQLGHLPNIILCVVGTAALYFCGKVAVTEKNICE